MAKKTAAKPGPVKYAVIRDTKEKEGVWTFSPRLEWCGGTTDRHLPTGDYLLEAFPQGIVIERKKTTGEFAMNVKESRFVRELERLDDFEHPFIVCEFSMVDLQSFPLNSGIPRGVWPKLRIKSYFLLRKLAEYQLAYKTKIILAGHGNGQSTASELFKVFAEGKNR